MARIGAALGVPDPPRTEAELAARIGAYRAELASTAQARTAARFLLVSPPIPAIARPPYGLLAAAAVSLLPGWARWPLRLPRLPVTEAAVIRPAGPWCRASAGPSPCRPPLRPARSGHRPGPAGPVRLDAADGLQQGPGQPVQRQAAEFRRPEPADVAELAVGGRGIAAGDLGLVHGGDV